MEKNKSSLAHDIITSSGRSASAVMALREGQDYFFNTSQTTCISYRMCGSLVLVFADPIGPPEDIDSCLTEFCRVMRGRGYQVVFYYATSIVRRFALSQGFRSLVMGTEALIDTDLFSLQGSDMRVVRNNVAYIRKQKIRFTWNAIDSISTVLEEQVMSLYRDWLKLRKVPELRNHLIPFPKKCGGRLLLAYDGENMLGVWSFFSHRHHDGLMLDLMIRTAESPRGLTEAAIVEALADARAHRVKELSLGFCGKIVSEEQSTVTALVERLLRRWYRVKWLYNFEDLLVFKQKFKPRFEPRYLLYPRLRDVGVVVAAVMWDQCKNQKIHLKQKNTRSDEQL